MSEIAPALATASIFGVLVGPVTMLGLYVPVTVITTSPDIPVTSQVKAPDTNFLSPCTGLLPVAPVLATAL